MRLHETPFYDHGPLVDTAIRTLEREMEPSLSSRGSRLDLGSAALRHALHEQAAAEASYDVLLNPLPAEMDISAREIVRRLEYDHVVKDAPAFLSQASEEDRTNPIVSVVHEKGLGMWSSHESLKATRVTNTEHAVLAGLQEYLQTAATVSGILSENQVKQARAMLENLTFIGNKEYVEAAEGIASYWKASLRKNPDLQILAVTGNTADQYAEADGYRETKSDEYLRDAILSHFSDGEQAVFAGRLITDPSLITATRPEDLKAIMVDDWTVSGTQLSDARNAFAEHYPQYAASLEVQLITANRQRLTSGLAFRAEDRLVNSQPPTPVRAYYLAHNSDWAFDSSAHVTGSHSSVDYDAEDIWENITATAREAGQSLHPGLAVLRDLPAAANIVRPYRNGAIDSFSS